jgi:hypothetical protein
LTPAVTSPATSAADPTRVALGWPPLIVLASLGAVAPVSCTQFTLGAVVSPLVGLGGEHSAVVPAVVMAVASALGFTASRLALAQPRASSSAIATS